jgi:hypothetical protein
MSFPAFDLGFVRVFSLSFKVNQFDLVATGDLRVNLAQVDS